ncbi:Pam16-domain-containing protein [Dipodascopsis uninucleata]
MAHRILVQVLVTGAQVFGRAFVQAYKQAAATSTHQAQSAAKQGGITLDEACRILNVRSEALEAQQVKEKFDHLFGVNSKDRGGSFYIQSKVFRAKERIDKELTKDTPPTGNAGPGSGADSTAAAS